ncbi:MAG: FHA domain-containing protein [Actinomycetota bacterium]|nr:FHA domain-containing protein [Actinomycetota bacterium]
MPDLVLDLLRFVFLGVLYIFIGRAVRAVYQDLRPAGARPPRGASRGEPSRSQSKGKTPRRAAVVEGENLKGKSFDLEDELVIGRAEKCHVMLDDSYVSQVHARIYPKDGALMLEDLGSTNGTYLNRRRITSPTELQRGDQVKVGKTVLEMRK